MRFFLLHAALKSHHSNRNIHRKSTLVTKKDALPRKLPSGKLYEHKQPGVPELATELNAVPSTKADGHPIWRWSFLPDWSGAQQAQLSPTRYTHTLSHTCIGRSYVYGTGAIVSMGASYGQLYFYFYAVECALEKEKSWGLLIVSTQEKKHKEVIGNVNNINWYSVFCAAPGRGRKLSLVILMTQ